MLAGNSAYFTRGVRTFSSQVKPWPEIRGHFADIRDLKYCAVDPWKLMTAMRTTGQSNGSESTMSAQGTAIVNMPRMRIPVAAVIVLIAAAMTTGCARKEEGPQVAVDVSRRYERARATRPNPDLWAAASERVQFVRKTMSDPFGGLIATAWYSPKTAPGERLRLIISILGPKLVESNLRILITKQVRRGGVWRRGAVSASTVDALHAQIMKAAQLRAAETKT